MKKLISPTEYDALDDRERYYYRPQWKEWRTIKVRAYSECECCGSRKFMGWEEKNIGVGGPNYYEYFKPFLPYEIVGPQRAHYIDSILNSSILTKRLLNDELRKMR